MTTAIVDCGREICGCLATAESREWPCTNGIGGFASGMVAGLLTRRYHGLLQGRYGGGPRERDAAYHQDPVWGWFLGPFALAHFRVYKDPEAAQSFLVPMAHHLSDYGVGSLAETFDGDLPCGPRGCIAQAWSVAETLRAWREIALHHSSGSRDTDSRHAA